MTSSLSSVLPLLSSLETLKSNDDFNSSSTLSTLSTLSSSLQQVGTECGMNTNGIRESAFSPDYFVKITKNFIELTLRLMKNISQYSSSPSVHNILSLCLRVFANISIDNPSGRKIFWEDYKFYIHFYPSSVEVFSVDFFSFSPKFAIGLLVNLITNTPNIQRDLLLPRHHGILKRSLEHFSLSLERISKELNERRMKIVFHYKENTKIPFDNQSFGEFPIDDVVTAKLATKLLSNFHLDKESEKEEIQWREKEEREGGNAMTTTSSLSSSSSLIPSSFSSSSSSPLPSLSPSASPNDIRHELLLSLHSLVYLNKFGSFFFSSEYDLSLPPVMNRVEIHSEILNFYENLNGQKSLPWLEQAYAVDFLQSVIKNNDIKESDKENNDNDEDEQSSSLALYSKSLTLLVYLLPLDPEGISSFLFSRLHSSRSQIVELAAEFWQYLTSKYNNYVKFDKQKENNPKDDEKKSPSPSPSSDSSQKIINTICNEKGIQLIHKIIVKYQSTHPTLINHLFAILSNISNHYDNRKVVVGNKDFMEYLCGSVSLFIEKCQNSFYDEKGKKEFFNLDFKKINLILILFYNLSLSPKIHKEFYSLNMGESIIHLMGLVKDIKDISSPLLSADNPLNGQLPPSPSIMMTQNLLDIVKNLLLLSNDIHIEMDKKDEKLSEMSEENSEASENSKEINEIHRNLAIQFFPFLSQIISHENNILSQILSFGYNKKGKSAEEKEKKEKENGEITKDKDEEKKAGNVNIPINIIVGTARMFCAITQLTQTPSIHGEGKGSSSPSSSLFSSFLSSSPVLQSIVILSSSHHISLQREATKALEAGMKYFMENSASSSSSICSPDSSSPPPFSIMFSSDFPCLWLSMQFLLRSPHESVKFQVVNRIIPHFRTLTSVSESSLDLEEMERKLKEKSVERSK